MDEAQSVEKCFQLSSKQSTEYDTIYASEYLTCSKKPTGSQLSLPHKSIHLASSCGFSCASGFVTWPNSSWNSSGTWKGIPIRKGPSRNPIENFCGSASTTKDHENFHCVRTQTEIQNKCWQRAAIVDGKHPVYKHFLGDSYTTYIILSSKVPLFVEFLTPILLLSRTGWGRPPDETAAVPTPANIHDTNGLHSYNVQAYLCIDRPVGIGVL